MVAQIKSNLLIVLGGVVLLWAVGFANLLTGHHLNTWGILPRTLSGLRGIPLSPFLHANLGHLLVNTVPFLVLGGLVALQGRRAFLNVSLIVIGCGGIALWLFGRTAFHIGASGLIFGYFGYLVARAWYDAVSHQSSLRWQPCSSTAVSSGACCPLPPTSLGKVICSACWPAFSPHASRAGRQKSNSPDRIHPKPLPDEGATLVVANPQRTCGQRLYLREFPLQKPIR